MVEYHERLRAGMKDAEYDVTALARAMGLSYQAVKKVYDGVSRFSAENNSVAARVLGVSSDWLATGGGQRSVAGPAVTDRATIQLLRDLDDLAPSQRTKFIEDIHQAAELAREAVKHHEERQSGRGAGKAAKK